MQICRRIILWAAVAAAVNPALSQPSRLQTLSARDIAQRSLPSVVLLVIDTGNGERVSYGSGFFVGPDVVATNFHVVERGISGFARIVGQEMKYEIIGFVAVDQTRDLALLKLKGAKARPLALGDSGAIAIGDEVFAVGNPRGLEGTFSQGIVSSVRRQGSESLLQITAAISPGSSGGPVLNQRGDVIGVAVGGITGGDALNFAIPVSFLKGLVGNQKPPVLLGSLKRDAVDSRSSDSADSRLEPPAPGSVVPRRASRSPSLSTEDVATSRMASLMPRRGAVTELRITVEGEQGGSNDYVFKLEDDCSFDLAENYRSYYDRNDDGIIDYLTIRVRCDDKRVTLNFTTQGTGLNLSQGVYDRVQNIGDSGPRAGLSIDGPWSSCRPTKGSFQVYDSQFEITDRYIRVISFGASFEQHCPNKAGKVSGTIYLNYVPPR